MSQKTKRLNLQSGQSIIEVVVVAFFVVTALVTLTSLTTISISRNRRAKERAVATRLAQEAMEWVKFERDRVGFDQVATRIGVYCLRILNLPTDNNGLMGKATGCGTDPELIINGVTYDRQMTIAMSGADLDITSTITWQSGSNPETITLQGKLTQWQR